MPAGDGVPSSGPESTMTPASTYASTMWSTTSGSPAGWMTTRMGISYFFANSKSRWSWAGTAITAPVPYSRSA